MHMHLLILACQACKDKVFSFLFVKTVVKMVVKSKLVVLESSEKYYL